MRIPVMGAVLAIGLMPLGCLVDDLGEEEAIDDATLDLTAAPAQYFVYRNANVCITAPCPVYTVISPAGERFDVARVATADEADWIVPYLKKGGVVVSGRVIAGSWDPGTAGPRLRVLSGIEPARRYVVVTHDEGHESPYGAVAVEGADHGIDVVDLGGYVPSRIHSSQTLSSLLASEWATYGFIAGNDPDRTLFASTGAAVSVGYHVIGTGLDCVTAPCPSWSVTAADGSPLGYASRIDISCLHLAPTDEASLVRAMYLKGGDLFGVFVRGSWAPGDSGDVLLIARQLD